MGSSAPKRTSAPRTRSGCLQCRAHHQKCDEKRPKCGLCTKHERDCQYGTVLKWGGRPFHRSPFGHYLLDSVAQIQTEPEGSQGSRPPGKSFIYGISKQGAKTSTTATHSRSAHIVPKEQNQPQPQVQEMISHNTCLSITRNPASLPTLPPTYKSLFSYFPFVASAFSCNEDVRDSFCTTFIPMAINTSHVMASVLNLAAVHRANAGSSQSKKEIALFQMVVAQQLQMKISETGGRPTETVIASVILLCLSEIVAGPEKDFSWRSHLYGAASLLSRDTSIWRINSQSPTRSFIARCFVSLVALANMSGSPVTEFVSEQALRMASSEGYSPNIDEFLAYSLELVPVFLEIGALVREQQQTSVLADITLASTRRDQPFKILHHLQNMLQSVQAHSTSKPSDIATVTEQDEYMRVNETYHLAAMLQIYQRVLRLPSSSDEIQEIVHRILTILPEITLRNSPCPGTVLLFPLFCAGCGAEEKDDRLKVRSILSKMSELYRLDAVKSCMRILDDVWSGGSLHEASSSNLGWEKLVEGTTDIILY